MVFQPAFANNLSVVKTGQHPFDETSGKYFEGSGSDDLLYVQQTTDGGYIVTGFGGSVGSGNIDVWLIKTDSNGNKIFDKAFGDSDCEYGYCVQQTSDGGYIITGHTWSYGAGAQDVWLVKTDKNGNSVWDKSLDSKSKNAGYNDILSIKTNEYRMLKNKAVSSPICLGVLENFPLLHQLSDFWCKHRK
jgi:hypothetical protein